MHPAPEADSRTLWRRMAFDVIGLPPDAGKVDTDPGAADLEVLLDSPHYGERWARHWLDLARYVDRTPDWLDSTKGAWLYRDWVVGAFRDDLPFDQFTLRQLAVDLLPGSGPEDLPALGFLGLSPTYFKELQLPPEIIKTTVADEWEEHVDALGRTFLGLTLACARCHDHKSDPVTMRDYYGLAGVFASVKLSERPIVDEATWAPVAKARQAVTEREKRIAELKKAKPQPENLTDLIRTLEEESARIRRDTPHFELPMANAVVDAALHVVPAEKTHGTKLDFRIGMARDLAVHLRGNPNEEGEVVPRRFLSAFPGPDGQPRPLSSGSGRLDLARALVEEAAPLTARVWVNRVWKQHFGRGLVDTPSEFGRLGESPSHPELLEDLAYRFVEHGWSTKWLHREILTSATWRQCSIAPESEARDPDNRWFGRMLRRRLEWEPWRDAILAGAGELDLTLGGPALPADAPDNRRRSLYGASDRQDMDAMLRIHDVPDPGAHSPWRTETLTPLQGLFALNAPFIHRQADALAGRLRAVETDRIGAAYARLWQREPSARERSAGEAFLRGREEDAAMWSRYAQALLVSNEMLFLD